MMSQVHQEVLAKDAKEKKKLRQWPEGQQSNN